MVIYKVVRRVHSGEHVSAVTRGELCVTYVPGEPTMPRNPHALLLAFSDLETAKTFAARLRWIDGVEVWEAEADSARPMDRLMQVWKPERFLDFWEALEKPYKRFVCYDDIAAIPSTVACQSMTLARQIK
jgi:antitoxin (DNA-binding transcriptional repressor) of toxin-antitoxin stability system